ncbi:MAG: DUF418 domain-containing protein [Verrucomicrobia bacterium]|nr:MAG: DUF418 domain-containing protein [Verrucomicrobiota bacterium]
MGQDDLLWVSKAACKPRLETSLHQLVIIAASSRRTFEVDVLRGVALLGIAVVNVPIFSEPWTGMPAVETHLDALCALIVGTFFIAKFFGLFAFLFGWAMVRMRESTISKGRDARRIWRRRMFVLFGIGLAHAILVFPFDILMIYGILGLILSNAPTWSRERLMKHALYGLLAVPISYFLLTWWMAASFDDYQPYEGEKYGVYSYALLVEYNFYTLGYCQLVNVLYNGAMSHAAICLGILASREGFFDKNSPVFSVLEKKAPLLWIVGITFNLPYGIVCALNDETITALDAFVMAMAGIGAPWLTAAYVVTITSWVRRRMVGGFFAAAGKMSLTAYVLEGILAGWLFYEYGLGWNMEFGAAATLVSALGIFVAIKLFCMAWLRFHKQGPLELIWRKIVEMKADPNTTGTKPSAS